MKQADLARALNVSPIWFCAVTNGRADAGKEFASKAAAMIGGDMGLWMMAGRRKARRGVVAKFLAAAKAARGAK